jgi:cytochrome c-type biogenesis protein CcmH
MSRIASTAALLAVAVLLAAGGAVAVRSLSAVSRDDAADRLAAELRCPDCQGLSVAESHTAAAAAIRAEIATQLAAGRSPEDVRQHFVARYGEWILLAPRDPLVWVVPVAAVAAGLAVLGAWAFSRRRRVGDPRLRPAAEASDDHRARVRDELEALDA